MNKKLKFITALILILHLCAPMQLMAGTDGPDPGTPSAAIRPWGFPEGDLQGDLYSGSAVYKLPIALPKGINGMAPSLALSYSSQVANSPYGVGWSLPVGTIWRDISHGVPKFNSNDTFIFELGSSGGKLTSIDGVEYREKITSAFIKFHFDGSQWTAKDRTGTSYIFGTTQAGSGGIFKWFLTAVTDVYGNSINYTYSSDQNQTYLARIEYCSNDALKLQPVYEVVFTWESRADAYSGFIAGAQTTTANRLHRIDVEVSNSPLHSYLFTYEAGPVSGRSVLKQVDYLGADGITTMPPTVFSYNPGQIGFGNSEIWCANIEKSYPESIGLIGERFAGDFNGDGKLDISAYTNTTKVYVHLSDGNHLINPSPWLQVQASLYTEVIPGDFDGDGKTDICLGQYGSAEKYWVALSTGSSFKQPVLWYTWTYPGTGGTYDATIFADVNGDGLADMIKREYVSPAVSHTTYGVFRFWVYLSTGSSFSGPSLWCSYPLSQGTNYWPLVGDFNGDGLADIAFWNDNYSGGSDIWSIFVALSTGSSFTSFSKWGQYQRTDSNLYLNAFPCEDFDHDGIGDQGLFYTYGSNGSSGLMAWHSSTQTFSSVSTILSGDQYTGASFMGDFDGDGIDDYGKYSSTNQLSRDFIVKKGLGKPADLLTSVTNSLGGSVSITYKPSTQYDNTGGSGISNLPFVVQTVDSIVSDDGMGDVYTTYYSHQNGSYNTTEREFRGFGYSKVTYPDNTTSETWYYQDDIFKGKPSKEEIKDASGNLYQRIEYTWQSNDIFSGVAYPHLAQKDIYTYDGYSNFKQTRETYAYDSYGNRVKTTEWGDVDIDGDERTVLTDFYPNQTSWIIGREARERLFANSAGTGSPIQDTLYYYDNANSLDTPPVKGELTRVSRYLDTASGYVNTNYSYDQYGNHLTVTDHLGNITTTDYDTKYHIFSTAITNAKGHKVNMAYFDAGEADGLFGQLKSITDPNGNITSYKYDKLGRLVKITNPYNTQSLYGMVSYQYGLNGPGNNYIMALTTEQAGTGNYLLSSTLYDGFGRTIQKKCEAKEDGKFSQTTIRYNERGYIAGNFLSEFASGNLFSYSSPITSYWTGYTYDPMGRVTVVTNADGTFSNHDYDNRVETVTDENGHKKIYTRDAYNRLVKVEERNANNSYFSLYNYDLSNNLFSITDSLGHIIGYSYDSLGRKTSMDDPDLGHWAYDYNAVGNMIKCADARGEEISYEYDSLSRLTGKSYKSMLGVKITYNYDEGGMSNGIGKRTSMQDLSGSTGWSYDAVGRVLSEDKSIDGTDYWTKWAYDAMGRIASITYPNNEIVNYTYDNGGNTANIAGYVTGVDYNAAGQMTNINLANNLSRSLTYDPRNNRPMKIQTPNLQDLSYVYDAKGNIKTITDAMQSYVKMYDYDDLDRMTQGDNKIYEYDSIGNITTADGTPYTYDLTHIHAIAYDGINQYTYDANGNMITGAGRTITYDPENRPISITTGNTKADFVYDGDGNRVKKTVSNGANVKSTIYVGGLYEKTI